jgi:hypothetical protein
LLIDDCASVVSRWVTLAARNFYSNALVFDFKNFLQILPGKRPGKFPGHFPSGDAVRDFVREMAVCPGFVREIAFLPGFSREIVPAGEIFILLSTQEKSSKEKFCS